LLDEQIRALGGEHPTTLQTMWIVAAIAFHDGDLAHAETLARTVLDARKRILGARDIETYKARGLLQLIHQKAGKCGAEDVVPQPATRLIEEVVVTATRLRNASSFEQIALQGSIGCSVDWHGPVDAIQRIMDRSPQYKQ
jgi:hypothetical protein